MRTIRRLRFGRAGVAGLALALAAALAPFTLQSTTAAESGGEAEAPTVELLNSTTLDEEAVYFVSYDGLVNTNSFQQEGILTYGDYQYAAWYTADRSAVLARRDVSKSGKPKKWKTLTLPHSLSTNDSHNTINLGVSHQDGRLHVAMDTHNTRVFYTKSAAGLLDHPGNAAWKASSFETIERTLDGLELGGITYPRFFNTPGGDLQMSYRTGGSGEGTLELVEYANGTWRSLGKWTSPDGVYTTEDGSSDSRNMYLHGIDYGPKGRLHASFTWREDAAGGDVLCHPGGLSNHDTGYVYSGDRGRTWRTQDGALAAETGTDRRVSIETPNHVVDHVSVNRALINQEAQAIDSAGRPHVVISYVPERFTECVTDFTAQRRQYGRTFHLYQTSDGSWRKTELPEPLDAFGRSRLILDDEDNAYVVMPRGRIVTASAESGWTDWELQYDGAGLNAFGEVLVDDTRAASEGIMSIMYQEESTGTTPSPLHVLDVKLHG